MSDHLNLLSTAIRFLQCPISGETLRQEGEHLVTSSGSRSYRISASGIPLFAEHNLSAEARVQQIHYDRVAKHYLENLTYPHTQEYLKFLDESFIEVLGDFPLGQSAEICCGRGEAFALLGKRICAGVGVDISISMLEAAQQDHAGDDIIFVQGDATSLPLADASFDSVFMLGGIHHVNDRDRLFNEIFRILRPGGRFFFREPVSDFFLWRWIRALIYRLSPALDSETERPLRYLETVPVLERCGFSLVQWRTEGFFGFCLFMNSDVLVFNRFFRFIPGIRRITNLAAKADSFIGGLPGFSRLGLQVIGCVEKPIEVIRRDPR